MAGTFLDTNILLYAVDAKAPVAKRKRARDLRDRHFKDGTGAISTQVLQEFFVNATRRLGLPAALVRDQVEELRRMTLIQVTPQLILDAIDLHRLSRVSFWDALVLRAAKAAGCGQVLTEDLNAGQVFDGVKVVNPFE